MANSDYNVKEGSGGDVINALAGGLPSLAVNGGTSFTVTNSGSGALNVHFYDGDTQTLTKIGVGQSASIAVSNLYYFGNAWIRFDYANNTRTIYGVVAGNLLVYISVGYPMAISDLKNFFSTTSTNLHSYYRGGSIVANIPENDKITTSPTGTIRLSDFIGVARVDLIVI